MSLLNLLETAIKLPVAAAWDAISLGNMGEGSSSAQVLRDHREKEEIGKAEKVANIIHTLRNK